MNTYYSYSNCIMKWVSVALSICMIWYRGAYAECASHILLCDMRCSATHAAIGMCQCCMMSRACSYRMYVRYNTLRWQFHFAYAYVWTLLISSSFNMRERLSTLPHTHTGSQAPIPSRTMRWSSHKHCVSGTLIILMLCRFGLPVLSSRPIHLYFCSCLCPAHACEYVCMLLWFGINWNYTLTLRTHRHCLSVCLVLYGCISSI